MPAITIGSFDFFSCPFCGHVMRGTSARAVIEAQMDHGDICIARGMSIEEQVEAIARRIRPLKDPDASV